MHIARITTATGPGYATAADDGWAVVSDPFTGPAHPERREICTVNIEGELAVVIGRAAHGLTISNAFDYVLGYTVVNDVTNLDRNADEEKIFQARAAMATHPEPVAGNRAQRGGTSWHHREHQRGVAGRVRHFQLPSTVAESIVYVAAWVPLGPGDVIMTGAPGTVVAVGPGDDAQITVAGIGSLSNPVT